MSKTRILQLIVFILCGAALLALGGQRLTHNPQNWRGWVASAIGIYFISRGYLAFRSKSPG